MTVLFCLGWSLRCCFHMKILAQLSHQDGFWQNLLFKWTSLCLKTHLTFSIRCGWRRFLWSWIFSLFHPWSEEIAFPGDIHLEEPWRNFKISVVEEGNKWENKFSIFFAPVVQAKMKRKRSAHVGLTETVCNPLRNKVYQSTTDFHPCLRGFQIYQCFSCRWGIFFQFLQHSLEIFWTTSETRWWTKLYLGHDFVNQPLEALNSV